MMAAGVARGGGGGSAYLCERRRENDHYKGLSRQAYAVVGCWASLCVMLCVKHALYLCVGQGRREKAGPTESGGSWADDAVLLGDPGVLATPCPRLC